MNLVDIVGGKVVIHPDLYFIPAFKNLYNNDTSKDKKYQEDIITYIVLMWKYNSPYYDSMDVSTREKKLKEQIFNDADYELDELAKVCEAEYKEFQYTRILKMLDAQLGKLDSALDEKKIKDLLAGMASTSNVIKSIESLKTMVKAEQMAMGKVKGDAKVNPYELAK